MKSLFRTAILTSALLMAAYVRAQSEVILLGHVSPCVGGTYNVHIQTWPGVQPPLDTTLQTGPDCGYYLSYLTASTTGFFQVSTSCDSGLTVMSDSVYFAFNFLNPDTVSLDLICGGYDCNGVWSGSALPGTACDDGDPTTMNDMWGNDCVCLGDTNTYDCNGVANGPAMPGTACLGMNMDSTLFFGVYTPACACVLDSTGTFTDCLGVLNGTNMPSTPCDDGNASTINDTWSVNCTCAGYVPPPCHAAYMIVQAVGSDSLLIPDNLWLMNYCSGGSGAYTFSWDFGDGSTSTENTPVHSYDGNGPYWLCVSIDDGLGCTDTYCDSVSVDSAGIYQGMVVGDAVRSSGFTVNVLAQGALGVVDQPSAAPPAIWPNPVGDELNITVESTTSGSAWITVLDMNGRVVKSEQVNMARGKNRAVIPIGELGDGMYLLRIGRPGVHTSERFVKAH